LNDFFEYSLIQIALHISTISVLCASILVHGLCRDWFWARKVGWKRKGSVVIGTGVGMNTCVVDTDGVYLYIWSVS